MSAHHDHMVTEAFLSRLERVKQTGPGRWIARCPSHEDRSPSLSIRELPDGRVLIHCFAGCGVEDVLGAVGLTFEDLFPEKTTDRRPRERKPFNAGDVLEAIADEVLIVAVAGTNLCQGALSSDDLDRVLLAAERLAEARRLANG